MHVEFMVLRGNILLLKIHCRKKGAMIHMDPYVYIPILHRANHAGRAKKMEHLKIYSHDEKNEPSIPSG